MFPRLSYLEWMGGRAGDVPYDLGSTDLDGDAGGRNAVVPPRLADLETPPAGATLEHLVASEYGVQPDQVLITAGATHANFVAYATALDDVERGSVLVERPGYEPLVETPRGLGASVTRFDRLEDGRLDTDAVDAALTDDTAIVTITNRHNPTGALATETALQEVAQRAATRDAPLLVDEAYAPFVADDREGPFGGPTAAHVDNAVVTGSTTKFFGLGDLRIGWLVGPASFVERARRVAYHLPDVAGPSRKLAARALYAGDEIAADRRDRVAANHRLLSSFVEEREDLAGTVHEGATFAAVEPTAASVQDVVASAWEEGVLVVPGRFFEDPDRIRLGAGGSPSDVEVALARFGDVLTDVRRTSNS